MDDDDVVFLDEQSFRGGSTTFGELLAAYGAGTLLPPFGRYFSPASGRHMTIRQLITRNPFWPSGTFPLSFGNEYR